MNEKVRNCSTYWS